jgi:hypothetical protein
VPGRPGEQPTVTLPQKLCQASRDFHSCNQLSVTGTTGLEKFLPPALLIPSSSRNVNLRRTDVLVTAMTSNLNRYDSAVRWGPRARAQARAAGA